jgi:hypothetical protein
MGQIAIPDRNQTTFNFRKSASRTIPARHFYRADNDACDHPLRIRSARMEGPTMFCFCLVFTEWVYTV